MAHPWVSTQDLMMFRFQTFYEDTIRSLVQGHRPDIGTPLYNFEFGELREATAIGALAVACGVLPRQPFRTMLESPDIKERLLGNPDRRHMSVKPLPPPITELPDWENVLEWSEIDMDEKLIPLMPALTATYASLMRQIRRDKFQRSFNATLLFSPEDNWQGELGALSSGTRNWFPARGSMDDATWLAEGLDSYLDLADDLGAASLADASGHVADFHVGKAGPMGTDDVKEMIELRQLLPLMAWRFGGAALPHKVSLRVRSLEDVIEGLVAELDIHATVETQRLGTGRYEVG